MRSKLLPDCCRIGRALRCSKFSLINIVSTTFNTCDAVPTPIKPLKPLRNRWLVRGLWFYRPKRASGF